MTRPELGKVVSADDILYPRITEALVHGLLGDSFMMGVGGDLTRWYNQKPANGIVKSVGGRVLHELRYRPTNDPNKERFLLGVNVWKTSEEHYTEGVKHTIPVPSNAQSKDKARFRDMIWAEVPLDGEVTINTTPETHERPGTIVVHPGEIFIAAVTVRELEVRVPVGSTNMELSFSERYPTRLIATTYW